MKGNEARRRVSNRRYLLSDRLFFSWSKYLCPPESQTAVLRGIPLLFHPKAVIYGK